MGAINSRADALNNVENATGVDNTTDDIGSDLKQDIIIFLIIHAKKNDNKKVLTPQELDAYYRIKKNFTKETSPEDIFMSKYYKYFTSIYNHAKTEIYKSDIKRIEKDIDNFILSLNQLNKSNNSLNIYTDEYLKYFKKKLLDILSGNDLKGDNENEKNIKDIEEKIKNEKEHIDEFKKKIENENNKKKEAEKEKDNLEIALEAKQRSLNKTLHIHKIHDLYTEILKKPDNNIQQFLNEKIGENSPLSRYIYNLLIQIHDITERITYITTNINNFGALNKTRENDLKESEKKLQGLKNNLQEISIKNPLQFKDTNKCLHSRASSFSKRAMKKKGTNDCGAPVATGAPADPRATGAPTDPRATGAPANPRATGAPADPRATGAPANPRATGAPDEPRATGAPANPRAPTDPRATGAPLAPADPLADPLANPPADPLADPPADPLADPLANPLADPSDDDDDASSSSGTFVSSEHSEYDGNAETVSSLHSEKSNEITIGGIQKNTLFNIIRILLDNKKETNKNTLQNIVDILSKLPLNITEDNDTKKENLIKLLEIYKLLDKDNLTYIISLIKHLEESREDKDKKEEEHSGVSLENTETLKNLLDILNIKDGELKKSLEALSTLSGSDKEKAFKDILSETSVKEVISIIRLISRENQEEVVGTINGEDLKVKDLVLILKNTEKKVLLSETDLDLNLLNILRIFDLQYVLHKSKERNDIKNLLEIIIKIKRNKINEGTVKNSPVEQKNLVDLLHILKVLDIPLDNSRKDSEERDEERDEDNISTAMEVLNALSTLTQKDIDDLKEKNKETNEGVSNLLKVLDKLDIEPKGHKISSIVTDILKIMQETDMKETITGILKIIKIIENTNSRAPLSMKGGEDISPEKKNLDDFIKILKDFHNKANNILALKDNILKEFGGNDKDTDNVGLIKYSNGSSDDIEIILKKLENSKTKFKDINKLLENNNINILLKEENDNNLIDLIEKNYKKITTNLLSEYFNGDGLFNSDQKDLIISDFDIFNNFIKKYTTIIDENIIIFKNLVENAKKKTEDANKIMMENAKAKTRDQTMGMPIFNMPRQQQRGGEDITIKYIKELMNVPENLKKELTKINSEIKKDIKEIKCENIKKFNDKIKEIIEELRKNNKFKNISDINYKNTGNNIEVLEDTSLFENIWNVYQRYAETGFRNGVMMQEKEKVRDKVVFYNLDPAKVLKVNFEDKFIFVVILYIIRLIVLIFIEFLIDYNVIKTINYAIGFYIILLIFMIILLVLIINFDSYKLRILVNYLNLHINSGKIYFVFILTLIFYLIIYIIINANQDILSDIENVLDFTKIYKHIYNIVDTTEINKKDITALNEKEKLKLLYRISIITMIVYAFTSFIIMIM